MRWVVSLMMLLVAAPALAQQLELVSASVLYPPRTGSDFSDGGGASISADGRFVVFESYATDLVVGQQDTSDTRDVFFRDRLTGTTVLVSHTSSAVTAGNGWSAEPSISADGNWVAFVSNATDLGDGFPAGTPAQVYLWERATGAISLVSHAASLTTGSNDFCESPVGLSADGAFVVFGSWATDLGGGFTDVNGAEDVFLYERATGAISLVSHAALPDTAGNANSRTARISANGDWVLFESWATDLGSSGYEDWNGSSDVFVYSRLTGAITLVSHTSDPNTTGSGFSECGEIDDGGNSVVFISQASNLGSGIVDTNGAWDAFFWERATGTITLLSHGAAANEAVGGSCALISPDGNWAAFCSSATDVGGAFTDLNGRVDAFLWQRTTGAITLVSYGPSPTTTANGGSVPKAIGGSGDYVVVDSDATDLGGVAWTDTNGRYDIFLYSRVPATMTLASRRAGLPTTTGDDEAYAWGDLVSHDTANGVHVVFGSVATNLVAEDYNSSQDVFLLANPTCAAPDISAVADGDNRIALSWPSAVGPLAVKRSRTSGGPYETLAVVDATSYVDGTAQRGVTYYYIVENLCGVSNEVLAMTTTGLCELPPDFEPMTAVVEESSGDACVLRVSWEAASAPCLGAVSYSVYRSTDWEFIPSGSNRIATGLAGLDYLDTTPLFGQTYYYIVRATDEGNLLEDTNLVRAPGEATACIDSEPPPVEAVTVHATQSIGPQEHALEWVVPETGQSVYCASTSGYLVPPDPGCTAHAGVPGAAARVDFGASDNTDSYYSVFAEGMAGYSAGCDRLSRSQSSPPGVDWSFTTGASALGSPYVRPRVGYYAVSNDRMLYAMAPDLDGGTWPTGWTPFAMNGAVQGRPVVLQLGSFDVNGAHTVAFVGSQDGHVYAIDAATGAELWDTDLGAPVQAAPSIVLTEQGGHYDLVMVGTRNAAGTSRFYALKPQTGAIAWMFDNSPGLPIGIISSKAQIDFANNLVYFTSRHHPGGSEATVWCLSFTDTSFTKVWAEGSGIPDVDSSPILRNGKLYVGDNQGNVRVFDPLNAVASQVIYTTPSGLPIKGYVVWREGVLYFSSGDLVYAIEDDGTPFWPSPVSVSNASPVLVWAGRVYVGGNDSMLHSIDTLTGVSNSIQLGNPAVPKVVGFPTADTVSSHVIVGTDQGIIYLVELF